MALTGEPGAAADVVETPRAVAARCAVAALHADGRAGHATRVRTARRARYRVALPGGGPEPGPGVCCRKSRLRGAFLALGSVNRPDRPPHVEIPVRDRVAADTLLADLDVLEVPATVRLRRQRHVVTVRSAAGVGSALSSIGAQGGRLAFEQGRVVRDVRAVVNRTLNAETANLRRTVDAAVRQLDAVQRLTADGARWEALPPALRAAGLLRSAHPDAPLEQLAEHAAISRSAMAGRLHRLVAAAQRSDWGS
jgi:hypothetical protein